MFQRGVSQVAAPKRICYILGRHIVERFLSLEDKSPKGPAQAASSSEISAEGGLDVPVGNSACSFSNDDVGQTLFPGGCFIGVFHRGVS